MSTIGITQPVMPTMPALPAQPAADSIALPNPAVATLPPDGIPDQVGYAAQSAEQARTEAVQKVAQQIANVFVLGDQTFSLFKDSTGQLITRFTSLRDGKVTYIPEPSLFKLGGSSGSGSEPLVTIKA